MKQAHDLDIPRPILAKAAKSGSQFSHEVREMVIPMLLEHDLLAGGTWDPLQRRSENGGFIAIFWFNRTLNRIVMINEEWIFVSCKSKCYPLVN